MARIEQVRRSASSAPWSICAPHAATFVDRKTARAITRGFVNAMKSGARVISPDRNGSGGRKTGNAVGFMLDPLWGARAVVWREQSAARTTAMPTRVCARSDVVHTAVSRDPPDGGHTATKGGCRRAASVLISRSQTWYRTNRAGCPASASSIPVELSSTRCGRSVIPTTCSATLSAAELRPTNGVRRNRGLRVGAERAAAWPVRTPRRPPRAARDSSSACGTARQCMMFKGCLPIVRAAFIQRVAEYF
jgi:hypothetical protein